MTNTSASESVIRVVIVCLGGIGNLLFLDGAVSMVCSVYLRAKISFMLSKCGSKGIVNNHPCLERIIEVDRLFILLFANIWCLRKLRSDVSMLATGTNPKNVGPVSIFIGARFRIGEKIGPGDIVYNVKIFLNAARHETDNNIAILSRYVKCNIAEGTPYRPCYTTALLRNRPFNCTNPDQFSCIMLVSLETVARATGKLLASTWK
jgi:hypothetical protein